MNRRIYVIGYPEDCGGASTELWHTCCLWRRAGLDVTLIPTWKASPKWMERLREIGCRTIQLQHPSKLKAAAGLAGSVVVSFCNSPFCQFAGDLRKIGCRLVWVACMCYPLSEEERFYQEYGAFDRHVFQSHYQKAQLLPRLAKYGLQESKAYLIRGAFDCEQFACRPRPHAPNTPFVVGRLSRANPRKFSKDTWQLYGQIPSRRARIMGWSRSVEAQVGKPPDWAECLPSNAEPVERFYRSLHCLAPINGGDVENWPRVGLEAMAAGVPVLAENAWGWREMIEHGKTGYLFASPQQFAHYAGVLAGDEAKRMEILQHARIRLVAELANPDTIWAGWQRLFDGLE